MKFTEAQLQAYSAPLSATEDQQCQNAIGMVRDALKLLGFSDEYKPITKLHNDTYAYSLEMRSTATGRSIKVFVQGSYANDTCVRKESDVDIAVVQTERFQTEYRSGITDAHYGFTTVPTPSKSFKDEVHECLYAKFGHDVERKDKSIKIHGNTYRKDADTVPCMRLRNYTLDYEIKESNHLPGIVILTDGGERIINYPEQHIENGQKKDNETGRSYKRMVRIMKKMRHLMEDNHYTSATKVSSFGLESLVWNIGNATFTEYPTVLWYTFNKVIGFLCDNMQTFPAYKEANGIKSLFPDESTKTVYQQFVTDLSSFYEYDIS